MPGIWFQIRLSAPELSIFVSNENMTSEYALNCPHNQSKACILKGLRKENGNLRYKSTIQFPTVTFINNL